MPRPSQAALSEARIKEAGGRTGQKFVDLRIDVHTTRDDGTRGRRLVTVGGLWNRRQREFSNTGGATYCKQVQIQPAQYEAFEWFLPWLEAYASGGSIDARDTENVWSVLFAGGRRGGKTHLAILSQAISCVAIPGLQAWIVSESINKSQECDSYIRSFWARQWYMDRGSPWWEYSLINGSQVFQKSAHDPEALKQGGVGIVLINEGQKIAQRAFVNSRGATADTGGLTIVAANPPDTAKGSWVLDFHDEVKADKRKAKFFHFDNRKNPYIVLESLKDLEDEVDERTYAIEIGGEFLPRSDVVFYNWSRRETEIEIPGDYEDITEEILAKHFRRGFDSILGIDFQMHPYMAAAEPRLFRDPDPEYDQPLVHFKNAVAVEGTEKDLAGVLEDMGYHPDKTVLICDASGWWQDAERKKGSASVDLLKQAGFRHCFRPDKKMKTNPFINERVKATLALILAKSGKRRLTSDPDLTEFNRAMREWETKSGVPYRRSRHAHYCDAGTYPIWRLFPRRRAQVRVSHRVIKGFSRRSQLRGV